MTETVQPIRRRLLLRLAQGAAAATGVGAAVSVAAQVPASGTGRADGAPRLSSPLGAPPPGSAAPGAHGPLGLPGGSGAGVHSPNSPFAPLAPRQDVVPWSVLTDVRTRVSGRRILPVFGPSQTALGDSRQRIQGFMMPLEPGERLRHFLLTSVPLTCSFCTPGGPESMVEVRAATPVRAALEPIVMEGRFWVLPDDPFGLYYRMTEAVSVS